MTTNEPKTYLVTGATRGIGAAIVSALLRQDSNKIIVGVRDTQSERAKELAAEPNVVVVWIDNEDDDSSFKAAKAVVAKGIDKIDVVFANAGITGDVGPIADTPPRAMREKFTVNTIAPLLLFSAFKPLLQKAAEPKLLVTSTIVSSIGIQHMMPAEHKVTAYAASKAATNLVVRRISLEEPWLVALLLHPGTVLTDMLLSQVSREEAEQMHSTGQAIRPDESAQRIVELSHLAKQSTHSGRFFNIQDGGEVPW